HVDHWETGRMRPSLESLRRLAELLDVSVDHLLDLRNESEVATPLERFFAELAPHDLSIEEEHWLRTAPLSGSATPQHYLRLLESLRGDAPQSGTRAKVDDAKLAEAVRRRARWGPTWAWSCEGQSD